MRAAVLDPLAGPLLPAPRARRLALFLLAAAVAILWLGAYTDLDLRLANAMFDVRTGTFPWRHAWLTERFGHGLLKALLTAAGAAAVAVSAWDALTRRTLPDWWRLRLRVLALSAILVPSATAMLKQASASHCPWDLERYGGTQPYFRLLEHMPAWVEAGHCLPGGHASSALWLVALAGFWLPHRPRTAAAVALAMLAFGGAVGWLQQMRGAHFLTHTLWSMWIAAAIVSALLSVEKYYSATSRSTRQGGTSPAV